MDYTLLLKNNGARKEYTIRGLQDEGTDLIHFFKNFSMPEGAQEGEYTYMLFIDNAKDPIYSLNDNLPESTVTSDGITIAVKYLNPEMGILRYEERESTSEYISNNKEYKYYSK